MDAGAGEQLQMQNELRWIACRSPPVRPGSYQATQGLGPLSEGSNFVMNLV